MTQNTYSQYFTSTFTPLQNHYDDDDTLKEVCKQYSHDKQDDKMPIGISLVATGSIIVCGSPCNTVCVYILCLVVGIVHTIFIQPNTATIIQLFL